MLYHSQDWFPTFIFSQFPTPHHPLLELQVCEIGRREAGGGGKEIQSNMKSFFIAIYFSTLRPSSMTMPRVLPSARRPSRPNTLTAFPFSLTVQDSMPVRTGDMFPSLSERNESNRVEPLPSTSNLLLKRKPFVEAMPFSQHPSPYRTSHFSVSYSSTYNAGSSNLSPFSSYASRADSFVHNHFYLENSLKI